MSVVQAWLRLISSEGDVLTPHLVARMNEFIYRSTPSKSALLKNDSHHIFDEATRLLSPGRYLPG